MIKLKTFRLSYGISQRLLAELADMERYSLSKIEAGERSPCLRTVKKIYSAFYRIDINVTPRKFLEESGIEVFLGEGTKHETIFS